MSVLAACGLVVRYGDASALDGVDLRIDLGESVALIGRSGSGKTTLLHAFAGLVAPSEGSVDRGGTTALVFQNANLIPQLSVIENVRFAQSPHVDAGRLLTLVGLQDKLDHLP